MKKVLENDFIAGWKRMNFYDRVVPESVMLLETLIDSTDTTEQKQWCAGLPESTVRLIEDNIVQPRRSTRCLPQRRPVGRQHGYTQWQLRRIVLN